jgi:hypothetical protein
MVRVMVRMSAKLLTGWTSTRRAPTSFASRRATGVE